MAGKSKKPLTQVDSIVELILDVNKARRTVMVSADWERKRNCDQLNSLIQKAKRKMGY